MSLIGKIFGLSKEEKSASRCLAGEETSIRVPRPRQKFKWGEVSYEAAFWNMGVKYWEHDGKAMVFVNVPHRTYTIYMPWKSLSKESSFGDNPGIGIGLHDKCSLHVELWRWGRFIDLPYLSHQYQKEEILDFDGNPVYVRRANKIPLWYQFIRFIGIPYTRKASKKDEWREDFEKKEAAQKSVSKVFDYTYLLKKGLLQHRKATVHVSRMTWGRKWFPWLKMVRTSIEVQFNDEVGEKTGSWKGGCIGCSYLMEPHETPEETLRRMERERVFK